MRTETPARRSITPTGISAAQDAGQYRAYRLSRARRDTILAAATPADLAALIQHADQAQPACTAQPPRE